MAETLAQHKFACPACGAEAIWNPAKQALVCPFCGTTSPAKIDATAGGIVEHDLVTALRGITDDKRGWQAEKRYVKCQSCQAISVLDPKRQAQRCEFCGSAQLVAYEQTKDAFRPESVLPFKISEDKARDGIRGWYGKLWLAPNALKRRALTDTVKGIYLPYWTFDAHVDATWTAEAGHYYYTTESYTDNDGRTQTRQVQHVRWEPASGRLQHFFDDDLICASVGVHPDLLRGIEPFPTNELVAYDAGLCRRLGRRALPDRSRLGGESCARCDGREAAADVRRAGTWRHVSQPSGTRRLFGADLQAHPRAGVAVELHVRREGVPGGHEWRERHDHKASIRRAGSRSRCWCSRF